MADYKNVKGFSELREAMLSLPDKVARNGLRRSVSAGAAIIRNEAKELAPVETGKLKKAIQMKRAKTKDGQIATYEVYVRTGKNTKGKKGKKLDAAKDAWYWKFLEFGTSKAAAQPFLRPAFDTKKDEAIEAVKNGLIEAIEQAKK